PALAGDQALPEGVELMAQRSHSPQTGDDHPAFCPIARHKINGAAWPISAGAAPKSFHSHLLLLEVFDVFDDVADTLELFGLLVGNFVAEFLFERHDQFHRVERIRPEILDEL